MEEALKKYCRTQVRISLTQVDNAIRIMSHEFRGLFGSCMREIGDLRSRVEKLEGKMASKVEEEELKSVREKLIDRLESLEKKIQDPPKRLSMPSLSVEGYWYDDIMQRMKSMGPNTRETESLEIKAKVHKY